VRTRCEHGLGNWRNPRELHRAKTARLRRMRSRRVPYRPPESPSGAKGRRFEFCTGPSGERHFIETFSRLDQAGDGVVSALGKVRRYR